MAVWIQFGSGSTVSPKKKYNKFSVCEFGLSVVFILVRARHPEETEEEKEMEEEEEEEKEKEKEKEKKEGVEQEEEMVEVLTRTYNEEILDNRTLLRLRLYSIFCLLAL